MTIRTNKPAINLREELASLRNQGGYSEQQFYFDNLVTNGTFNADASGWAASNAVVSWDSNGYIVVDDSANAGSDSNANQTIRTVVGKKYMLSVNRISTNTAFWLEVFGATQLVYTGSLGATTGTYSVTFVADSASTSIRLITSSAGVTKYDNVSVFEVDADDEIVHGMPKGWKPKDVFEDGLLQREGSGEDYEVIYDGFTYKVKPTVEPTASTQTTVIGVKA